jgi:hypothetical protein
MPTYLVERVLPGADLASVQALCRSRERLRPTV